MAWIELHQAVWTHRKTFELASLLDLDETYAAAHVIRLWSWALDNAPDGNLSGLSDRAIAYGAGWRGEVGIFLGALVDAGWLDDDRRIHDWEEYAGRLVERRQENARRARIARATRRGDAPNGRPHNVAHTSTARVHDVGGLPDRTGPDRTIPPSPQPPPQAEGEAVGAEPAVVMPSPTVRPVPKPSRSGRIAKLGRRVDQVERLVQAAGVPVAVTPADATEVNACDADPSLIAEAYVAAYRGAWDPGGSGWLRGSLSLRVVVGRLAGYQAVREHPPPARNGRHGGPAPPATVSTERRDRIAAETRRNATTTTET